VAALAVGFGSQSLGNWHACFAPQPEFCREDVAPDELPTENQRLRRSWSVRSQSATAASCEGVAVKYARMPEHRDSFPGAVMC
jgi:hypothetical protein